jgi:YD repeat-containing protein
MITAYDDPTGVTAAFNLNILARINRELGADFDLRSFAHEVRWNSEERRIEMHLLSGRSQVAYVGDLDTTFEFRAGETICTEFSHKFTQSELLSYARLSGFTPIEMWVDKAWPFAEALWQVD